MKRRCYSILLSLNIFVMYQHVFFTALIDELMGRVFSVLFAANWSMGMR